MFCNCDTTRQHKPHITQNLVCYPWHPWYGKEAVIHQSVVRWDKIVFQCTLVEVDGCRSLEVPQWMFDRSICNGMHLADAPAVGCDQLRSLLSLLRDAAPQVGVTLQKNQHPVLIDKTDVKSKVCEVVSRESTGSVSVSSQDPVLAKSADRGESASGDTAGASVASTSGQDSKRRPRPGGRVR